MFRTQRAHQRRVVVRDRLLDEASPHGFENGREETFRVMFRWCVDWLRISLRNKYGWRERESKSDYECHELRNGKAQSDPVGSQTGLGLG